MKKLNRQQQSLFVSIAIAILLFIGASIRHPAFGSMSVFVNLLDDNAFLGIAAVGMTFVILSGGIDLSVGSMVGLTSVLMAILVEHAHWHPVAAILACLAVGALLGTVMGLIIAYVELAPFLVTLAGMFFARGLAFTLSLDSIPLTHSFVSTVSQMRLPLGIASLPMMSLVFLFVVAAGAHIAYTTRFGRAVYAIGGSEVSSRLMGLPVSRTQVLIYTLSGTLSALAGVVYSFYTQSGNSSAATGLELDAIAAVVIGGTLLSGGQGYVVGTLIGTLILGMIQTVITFESNLNSWWTRIVIGALLLVFVLLQKILASLGNKRADFAPDSNAPAKAPAVGGKLTGTFGAIIIGCSILASTSHTAFASSQSFATRKHIRPAVSGSLQVCPSGQYAGRKIEEGLYQLTGTFLTQGQRTFPMPELPDPAPPYITPSGEVELFGSARYFIRYRNWKDYSEGGCYQPVTLDVYGPNARPYDGNYAHPWDLRKYRIERKGELAREVLIGGSMSATKGRPVPIWPEDNINRRIYFFRLDQVGRWIRDLLPIVERIGSGWLGHSYGGNLIQDNSPDPNVIRADRPGDIAFFYEKVSDAQNDSPFKTEIFAVRMSDPDTVLPGTEIKIAGVQSPALPSTRRTGGGYLLEGPRPLQVTIDKQTFFIVGFSSGDFPTDSYYVNAMWSRNLFGPYLPILSSDGKDLLDLGRELKARYGLSWVGRPSFYKSPDGHFEMLFHGVIKSILPDNDYTKWPVGKYELWEFYRCLFKTSIDITLDNNGAPQIRVMAASDEGTALLRARAPRKLK